MKPKVLLIQPTIQPVGVDILKEHCEVFMAPDGNPDTLIQCIREHQCQGVVTRVEQITREVIQSCPSLKVIGQHGVGLDNIDVQAATDHGVMVLNVPDANYVSVAEHAMMFVLALSRDLRAADQAVRAGNWKFRETNIPNEVAGKTLVIVGLGTIGRDVAKKALSFDMRVVAFDAYVSAERMQQLGVEKAETLEEALKQADFISIHAPLTPETRGMFSTPQFQMMKPTACLINLGRGPVVDQAALVDALTKHEIAAAALDVFEQEPPQANDPLFALSNLIVTPHFGGDTIDAKRRCSQKLAQTMVQALEGEKPYNFFNRKALEAKD
ncbi:MAG: hydroxyacid dehydrogenase [Lawsonibacter sp.]|jgi:D-3-phosphoglycerate dehydrogenase